MFFIYRKNCQPFIQSKIKVRKIAKKFKVWSGLGRVISKRFFLQIVGACHKSYKMQKWQFLIVYSAFSGKTFFSYLKLNRLWYMALWFPSGISMGQVVGCNSKRHVCGKRTSCDTFTKHCNVRNHRRISFKFIYQKRSEIWRRKSLKPFRNWIEKTWLPLDEVCLK